MNSHQKRQIDIIALVMAVAVALCATLAIDGCSQPIEMTARDVIAANHGVLTAAQAQHRAECTANHSLAACQIIAKDISAQNLAIDALEAYCGSVAFNLGNAPCEPHAPLRDKLAAALLDLNQDMNDVKSTIK
jgi:hypothetical protein